MGNIAFANLLQENDSGNAESMSHTGQQSLTVLPSASPITERVANLSMRNAEKGGRDSVSSLTTLCEKNTYGDKLVTALQYSLVTGVLRPVEKVVGPLDKTTSSAISKLQDEELQTCVNSPGNSNVISEGYAIGSCIQVLNKRVSASTGQYPFSPIELARVSLVHQAILREDYFYLFLHQCVSLSTMGRHTLQLDFLNMPRASEAFKIVDKMLVPSTGLRSDLLMFFTGFPVGLSELQTKWPKMYTFQVERVSNFLVALLLKIDQFATFCKNRMLPPMAHQIDNVFEVSSPILQQLLFTSLFRRIWPDVDEMVEEKTFNLFIGYQDQYILGKNSKTLTENPPFDVSKAEKSFNSELRYYFCQPYVASRYGEASNILPQVIDSGLLLQSNTSFRMTTLPLSNQNTAIYSQSHYKAHGVGLNMNSRSLIISECSSPNLQHERIPARKNSKLSPNCQQEIPNFQISCNTIAQDSVRSQSQSKNSSNQPNNYRDKTNPASRRLTYSSNTSNVSQAQGRAINQQRSSVRDLDTQRNPIDSKTFKIYSRLIPRNGHLRPQRARSYPEITALHQSHLVSPLEMTGPSNTTSSQKFSRQVARLCMSPSKLEIKHPVNIWTFLIGREEKITASGKVDVSMRSSRNNEQYCMAARYRLRCSMYLKSTEVSSTAEDFWTASVNCWPDFLYVKVNSHLLEFRRKLDYGRDIPVDISDIVHEGRNTVQAYINLKRNATVKSDYFIFIEEIETAKLEHCRETVLSQRSNLNSTFLKIKQLLNTDYLNVPNGNKDNLKANCLDDNDDDRDLVIIGSSSTTINLFDPISSSRIYDIPVRGKYCNHLDCFDLDTFLQSRPSQIHQCRCRYHHDDKSTSNEVGCSGCSDLDDDSERCAKGIGISISAVDKWKCPLCKCDARPKSLVVDEFLLNVRAQLARNNMLDTRTIRVDAGGNWEAVRNNDTPRKKVKIVTIVDDDEGSDKEGSPPLRRRPRRQRGKLVNATKKVREKVVINLVD